VKKHERGVCNTYCLISFPFFCRGGGFSLWWWWGFGFFPFVDAVLYVFFGFFFFVCVLVIDVALFICFMLLLLGPSHSSLHYITDCLLASFRCVYMCVDISLCVWIIMIIVIWHSFPLLSSRPFISPSYVPPIRGRGLPLHACISTSPCVCVCVCF
jgi:hypothetical protein